MNNSILKSFGLALIVAPLAAMAQPACTPPPSGLVSWWPGEGNAIDIVSNNNGTIVNNVGFAPGEVGQAFSLSGSAYVSIPDSPSLHNIVSNITIEAWIQVPQGSGGDWNNAVSKGNYWGLRRYGGNPVMCFTTYGLNTGNVDMGGNKIINDGQWHHVAGVYDGTTKFLYVDGVLDASSSATGAIVQNSDPVCFGEDADQQSYHWNGLVDEVSIYDRALTASEVYAIYAAGAAGKCLPNSSPPAPVIISQPTGQTNLVGTTAMFSVGATNSVPGNLSYQWRLDGTNLPAATSNVLILTNLTLSQAGSYDVMVANSFCSVTSSPAILDVRFILVTVNGQPAAGTMSAVASAEVAITGGYPDGFIFYTLDGSTPTAASTLYLGPFAVTNSALLQVMGLSLDFSQYAFADPVQLQIIPGYALQATVIGGGTISANPTNGPYASNSVVTLTATPGPNWAFDHWAGDATGSQNPISVTMNRPLSVQAVFVPTAYPLTASTPGGGSVTANGQVIAPATYYPTGSVVTLAATASNGWSFLGWQGDASGTNNPLNVTMNQTNNIQAIFGTVVGTNAVGGGSIVLNQPNPVPFGATLTASAVPNSGKYFVIWSGSASGTNAPTTISVTNANPTINALFAALPGGKYSLGVVVMGIGSVGISPQKSYYNAGDSVTLNASTTNAGTTFYGWTGDASGTNDPLVVVMNSNHIVQANFGAQLTVSVSPLNLIVVAGSNAVLTASASGLQPLTYQWQNSQGTITGATNPVFTIYSAQQTNADNYTVVVSNPFQSVTSAVATVTVVFAPSISLQPTNQTVAAGTTATLSVGAGGTLPLNYQWFDSLGAIPDATNANFTLNPAQTNNWDNYFVVVSNAYGVVTSTAATLVVYAPVTITAQPVSLIVPFGYPVSFSVMASGFPAPTYQWTLNGTNLAGATSNPLTINQTDLPNLGTYQVLVSNGYSSTNSAIATLSMSPSITSPFTGGTTIWGRSATFSVGAVGSGELSYQWYLNGMAIDGATSAMLNFPSIQFTNGGLYSVVVSSPFGVVTNEAGEVTVTPAGLSLGFCPALTISGVAGYSYVIQSTTNVADTNAWNTLTTLTLTAPVELWVDTNVDASSPFNSKYFYRVLPGQ